MERYEDDNSKTTQGIGGRLPLILGVSGAALGALAMGFVIANALSGGSSNSPTVDVEPSSTVPGEGPSATPEQPGQSPTAPPPGATTIPPTATPVPPTPTPAPPTPRPAPELDNAKYWEPFRATGGDASTNAKTQLPNRRLEANWLVKTEGCPGAGCIRGRASVMTAIGPLGTGESPVASALVSNHFVARRAAANLLMDLRWKGTLNAIAGANVNSSVDIEVIVSEVNPDTRAVVKALPGMPYSVVSEELGLEAITGLDSLDVEDSRSINVPLKLTPDRLYRIELKITCSTRSFFTLSATTCSFWDDKEFAGVEWTKLQIEYDRGLCTPQQKGDGCIYE